MTPVATFAEQVTSRFAKRITDQVFLLIQSDRELMFQYLRLVEQHGLMNVNQQIGKHIKSRFNLTNDDSRQDSPTSLLIQSHQEFQ
jgi:hypothetical protein